MRSGKIYHIAKTSVFTDMPADGKVGFKGKMKIKIILLTALLTAWSAVGFTQSIMARQLEFSKPIEVDSSTATGKALTNYLMQHYKIPEDSFGASLYKVPGASNLYFAIGSTGEQNTEEQKDLVLVLEAQGKTVNEVAKVYEKGMQGPIRSPLFFVGPNRILMVVSSGFADGGFVGDNAYEYAGNKLRWLGEIGVYDQVGEDLPFSPMEGAVAEYKTSTYYVTMRGKGSLYRADYSPGNTRSLKKIAPPGKPVTFFSDGKTWRQVAKKQIRRR
jgi:hypothetical protein